jgi:meiotically up-regulated gene 157 (Mug157) protein
MAHISAIFGTDDDKEIMRSLYLVANVRSAIPFLIYRSTHPHLQNTAGLGLIHESQSIYNPKDYTRSWFAWVRR